MSESIYWIDSEGGSLHLTDGTIYNVLQGLDGRFMPPFDFITDEYYQVAGDSLRLTKTRPRDITLPIIVYGTSETDLRTNLRMLTDAFDPTRGEGMLKVVTPDSKTLLLNCHYLDGMTLPESPDTGSCSSFRKFVATFRAHDPYWYNALENVRITWGSSLLEQVTVLFNSGDVDTWPIWEISGPVTGTLSVWNYTTSLYFTLTGLALINEGDVINIDTRPKTRSIYYLHRGDYFPYLTSASTIFPLVPGDNQIQIIHDNESTDTFWRCRWVDRYNGV